MNSSETELPPGNDAGDQPDVPPKPFTMSSGEVPPPPPFPMNGAGGSPGPYRMNGANPAAPPPMRPIPPQNMRPLPAPKPKAPFSPIPLLLFAGVAFLFLGGVLVLKQTWSTLADSTRAFILLLSSMMFFGANVVADKAFKLPKTGLAFYILGTIFLPLSVAAIGVFKLFGPWFAVDGDGRYMVGTVICACAAVTTYIGTHKYKTPILAFLSLASVAAGVLCFDCFLIDNDTISPTMKLALFSGVYTAFTILSLLWTEQILRSKPDSLFGKVAIWYQYPMMLLAAVLIGAASLMTKDCSPIPGVIAMAVLFGCFFYPRFDSKTIHYGAFGMMICLVVMFGAFGRASVFAETGGYAKTILALTAASLSLMTFRYIPRISDSLRATSTVIGYALTVPLLVSGSLIGMVLTKNNGVVAMHMIMMMTAAFFYVTKGRNKLSEDALPSAVTAASLFLSALVGCVDGYAPIMQLLLVIAAALLIAQAFLSKKIWCFVLAASAAAAMLILNLKDNAIWLLWLCTAVTLAGVFYAHTVKRVFLEKCFAWCFIACSLPALMTTLKDVAGLNYAVTLILVFALLALMYLLEIAAFPSHERVKGTKLYLEILSGIGSISAMTACLVDKELENGWYFLLAILLGVFVIGFVTKKINFVSVPYLIMFFVTVNHLITQITEMQLTAWGMTAPGNMKLETVAVLLKVGCYLVLLAVLALTGRFLLPKFYESDGGVQRVDFPLLTGILVIGYTVSTLDWYPYMLFCLFMSVYSLLFIGRVDNRYVPPLLGSLFGNLTLLFHNIYDPFGLLEKLSVLDIKTLPIIFYLLPAHLFILSLLVILPQKCRDAVHLARFIMYCITMLTLLGASMYFNNVTDALVLVVFSFLILVGSFVPKRLRWFTLGFAVLVFMTLRLTWSFWMSLHWGIYLFLAGILLIVIASLYEYSARYAREHPDEPKKKFNLFATWKW
jgi:hypothetical protein